MNPWVIFEKFRFFQIYYFLGAVPALYILDNPHFLSFVNYKIISYLNVLKFATQQNSNNFNWIQNDGCFISLNKGYIDKTAVHWLLIQALLGFLMILK